MRILNVSHGEFLMLGAYLTYWAHLDARASPFAVLPVVLVALFGLGLVIHRLCFRRLAATTPDGRGVRGEELARRLRPHVLRSERGAPDLGRRSSRLPVPRRHGVGRRLRAGGESPRRVRRRARPQPGPDRAAANHAHRQGGAGDDAVADGALLVGIDVRRMHPAVFGVGLALAGVAGALLSMVYEISRRWASPTP